MQAAYTTAYGGPDKVEYSTNFPKAQLLADDHVLIRVANASINPVDGLRNRGMLRILISDEHPHVFGFDVAGFVEEVGPKVTTLKEGDRVFGRTRGRSKGTLAGYVSAESCVVTIAPKNLPLAESAGIPLVGLTVLQSFEAANLQRGQRIFISKGGGGVGTFAIQMAKNVYGAYVITTGSEHKTELLKSLGADEVIDYRKHRFQDVIKEPVDFAYDVSNEPLAHAQITKKGGYVIALRGAPTPETATKMFVQPPGFIVSNLLRVANFVTSRASWWYGVNYNAVYCNPSAKELDIIRGFLEEGKIKPIVDSTFELKNARQAMEKLETGRATGKIILSVDESLDSDFQSKKVRK